MFVLGSPLTSVGRLSGSRLAYRTNTGEAMSLRRCIPGKPFILSLTVLIVAAPIGTSWGHCSGRAAAGDHQLHHPPAVHGSAVAHADRSPRHSHRPTCCKAARCVAALENRTAAIAPSVERARPHPQARESSVARTPTVHRPDLVVALSRGHPGTSLPFRYRSLFLAYVTFVI